MMLYGLIGYPLGHSFSKRYFTEKFKKLKLTNHEYQLFELKSLNEFPSLWMTNPELIGVNVTVPYKEEVLKYLDRLDTSAMKVGAVNVVKKEGGKFIGYNTDYMAFRDSLRLWAGSITGEALILGNGGSSKAVQAALDELSIPFNVVSRSRGKGDYDYDELNENPKILDRFMVIINSTPLGMHPKINLSPDIPYKYLNKNQMLYDLIYNPAETLFLSKGRALGLKTKNGLEMLTLQAEKSWEIWTGNYGL